MRPAVSVREAVGVFDDADRLQEAIDDLMTHGFDRAEISLLASESAVEKKLGHKYVKASELEDDPKVPKRGYVSPEELGAAEGAVIGGLMYVGAGLLLGPVAAAGATLAGMAAAAAIGGGVGREPRQADRRQARPPYRRAAQTWGPAAVGSRAGRRAREAGRRDPVPPVGPRRPRP